MLPVTTPHALKAALDRLPRVRLCHPPTPRDDCTFLASDQASSITGEVLDVDSGTPMD